MTNRIFGGVFAVAANLLAIVGALALLFVPVYIYLQHVLSRRISQIELAISGNKPAAALADLLILARDSSVEQKALPLARRYWLSINRSETAAHSVAAKTNDQAEKVLYLALLDALEDIASSADELATTRTLLPTIQNVFNTGAAYQLAVAELARAAMMNDPAAAPQILRQIPRFSDEVLSATSSLVLGAAFFLEGRYDKLTELRKQRIPELRPPLTADQASLLAWEVRSRRESAGLTEARNMAHDYRDRGLFPERSYLLLVEPYLRADSNTTLTRALW